MSEPENTTAPVTAVDDEPQTPDPNAPWSPDEGIDVEGLDEDQVSLLRATLPVVQEMLEWFDEQIAGYLNPNVISKVTTDSDPQVVKDSVLFAQQLSRDYSKKRKQFEDRFEPYLKPPELPTEE